MIAKYLKYQSFTSVTRLTPDQKPKCLNRFQDEIVILCGYTIFNAFITNRYESAFSLVSQIASSPSPFLKPFFHTMVLTVLGICYYRGEGTEQDIPTAIQCWKKAAELNSYTLLPEYHPLLLLGDHYFDGTYTEKNLPEAFQWFEKAAEQNLPRAYNMLGIFYCFGMSTEQNYEKAANYFQKGADLGNADAQFNLALLYKTGIGVSKNRKLAHELLQQLADKGEENAKSELKKFRKPFWSFSPSTLSYQTYL